MTTDTLLAGLAAFALRATVLLVAAWLATKLLRRGSASARHLIWTSAIAGVLALPILSAWLPEWNVPLVPIVAQIDAPSAQSSAPVAPVPPASPATSERAAGSVVTQGVIGSTRSGSERGRDGIATASRPWWSRISMNAAIVAAWMVVAVLLLARLVVANARVVAWRRSSRLVEDARWLTLLRRLTEEHGIARPVVLLENDETDVPVTWGIVYPVILLPTSAHDWDEEQRVAVLTHELAHVKRFDALSQMLGQLVLAVLWFHPLVWIGVRRMRLEREHACDDFVLLAGARASRYADDLLAFARQLTRPTAPAAAALAMARRSELEGRLLAILDPALKRTAVRRARVGVLAFGAIVLAAPLAAFRPAARVQIIPVATTEPATQVTTAPAAPGKAVESYRVVSQPFPALVSRELYASGALGDLRDLSMSGERRAPAPRLEMISKVPALLLKAPADTEPPAQIDVATLIAIAREVKKRTSDYEKGLMLAMIVKRYQPVDSLRDAYLDAVFSLTSDYERAKALTAFLDVDSLPLSSTARVLRSAAAMTSDASRGAVLRRISPSAFTDTAVQRSYLAVIVAMTSNTERAAAIGALLRQRPLTPMVQLGLMRAVSAITANTEKANAMLLFVEQQGLADDEVRKTFFKTAESLTSDYDYRRVIAAVIR